MKMVRVRSAASLIFLLSAFCFVGCQRETPAPPQQTTNPPATPAPSKPTVAPAPRKPVLSTPQKCAGDGSYEQAVDCFRMAATLQFTVDSPALKGSGAMSRPRIGEERADYSLKDGKWAAEAKTTGLGWTRNGQKATPPPELERLHQQLSLFLEPQKKEGAPQLAGTETVAATLCNHFHYTDANNGDAYDFWVSLADGHIVQMRIGAMTIVFR